MHVQCTNYVFDTGEPGELTNEGQMSMARPDKQAQMSVTQGKSRHGQAKTMVAAAPPAAPPLAPVAMTAVGAPPAPTPAPPAATAAKVGDAAATAQWQQQREWH